MTFEIDRSGDRPSSGSVRPKRAHDVKRRLMTALVVVSLLGAPSAGFAASTAGETGREGGLGAAAALTTLIYGPVKLIYATGGLIISGFAWAFTGGDSEVAERVLTRSLRGTYVLTPEHLTGEREVVFIGRTVEEPSGQAEAVASATTASASTASTTTTSTALAEPVDESGYDEMGW